MSLIIGSGTAEAVCTPVTAGQVLTCAKDSPNPDAFTATNDFTVDILGDSNAAEITRTTGNVPGLQINTGNFNGTITMETGATITTDAGGDGRHGLFVDSSAAATTNKTYTIDIDGSIIPASATGDALRLQGNSFSVFDITIGKNNADAQLGGGTGDDSVQITGAQSVLLNNYGKLVGGTGQLATGDEGINVGNNDTRIAAGGIVINNYGTITGKGDLGIVNGQGIKTYSLGDTTITNSGDGVNTGVITGIAQGVRVDAAGIVTITNDGHIQGYSGSGVEVVAGTTVNITNTSPDTIEGATNGLYVHDVTEANVDNDHGHIIGHDGEGVLIDNISGNVTVKNRFGESDTDNATITGTDDGVHASNVGGSVSVDNRFGGTIKGYGGDGVHVYDADGTVTVNNALFGDIRGHDDGVHISDAGDDVRIDNNFGGNITGYRGDGVYVHDADGSVTVSNALFGDIRGHDDGVHVGDADDDVTINNSLGGTIVGWRGDGVDIQDVRDDVRIYNVLGGNIAGDEDGLKVRDARGDVTVNNSFGGQITGHDDDGIDISDIRHDVTIDNKNGGEVHGRDAGARVSDVRGEVTIDNTRGEIAGRHGSGVDVSDVRGDVSIDGDGGTIGGGDDGVRVSDVRGDAGIHNWNGEITGGDDGVHLRDVHDSVTVHNNFGGSIIGNNDDGVDIEDIGDNATVYNIAGNIEGDNRGVRISDVDDDVRIDNRFGGNITGHDGNGIDIDNAGDDVTIKNGVFGDITGHDDGIHISDVDDHVTIDNRFGGNIRGRHDDGIDIQEVDDDVSIDNRFGGNIIGDDDGVKVHHADGDVSINNSFGGDIRGRDNNGIDVEHVDGDVTVDNRHGGSIVGHDNGIGIHSVDGDVTIENGSGEIRGRRGDGITANADGAVTVNNGRRGNIRGDDAAISVDAQSAEINSRGEIRGSGSDDPTIRVTTTDGATINNKRGGTIRGDDFATTDVIVEAHGGAVTINNAGTMMGQIDLSDAGASSGNVFNNTSNHSWHFTGTSQLGNGLADVHNNTGTIYTTDPNDPSNNDITELAGVETFNNGSSVKSGTINLQDGFTGDVFTLSPTDGGTLAFNGEAGNSFLKVDSFLGTPSDSSSDTLVINGNVAGSTGIQVNNVNAGFGGYNPTGIDVVNATGSLSPENFYLAGGPIDTGLFNYNLYLNGANEWVLASSPNQTFFELPSLTSAAQSMWHNAAGIWLDGTADLRASAGYGCVADRVEGSDTVCGAPPKSGAWAKVLGTTESRSTEHSSSLFNTAQNYTVDYRQSGTGFMGGYDFARPADDGKAVWMAGVMGGYLTSNVDFKHSATGADFESGMVGGYLTYLRGGWFVDGKVVANLGDVDYSGGHAVRDNANVTSIGGVLDTGYRRNYGTTFIEPGATLAYVNTDIDDLSIYGTSVNFSSGESLRGRLGLRLGTTIQNEKAKYEPFVGVSAWYEFLGDNDAGVTSGSYVLNASDDVSGAIGEVSGGVNIFSLAGDNFSGFVKGNVEFGKDDFVGYGGTFGVRFGW